MIRHNNTSRGEMAKFKRASAPWTAAGVPVIHGQSAKFTCNTHITCLFMAHLASWQLLWFIVTAPVILRSTSIKYKPTSISFTEAALTGSSQRLMLACVHARREFKWLFMSWCAFLAWLGGSGGKSCSLLWCYDAAVGRAGWMKEAGSRSFLQRRRTWLSAGLRHVNTTLRNRANWKWQDRGAPHECD